MGCAASSEVAAADVKSSDRSTKTDHRSTNDTVKSDHIYHSHEKNNNNNKKESNAKSAEKSVAFEIGFESNIDSLISKHPPKRLQHLAPLPESAPKLTSQQLQEKIRLAEENRQKELDKKKDVSRRSNRLRQEVMRAREQEKLQEQHELNDKLKTAERARQKKHEEMAEKKRIREERAQRARERAKKMKTEGGEELDYELEKDDGFNQDDDDSWLDGDNNTSDYHTDNDRFKSGDHVYNGRTSPAKAHTTKAGNISAFSSADSSDYQRKVAENTNPRYDRTQVDDFFDS